MKLLTRTDKAAIRHHFLYSGWQYLVLVAASVFLWNLIYLWTAYRPPQDKRIDLYIQSATAMSEDVEAALFPIAKEKLPDLELLSVVMLSPAAQDDYYAMMRLSTYMAAQEGDIYLLEPDDFKRYAAQGIFVPLEPLIKSGAISQYPKDLSAGYVTLNPDPATESDAKPALQDKQLFGIPLREYDGMREKLNIDNRRLILAVTLWNQNDDNVIRFIDHWLNTMH